MTVGFCRSGRNCRLNLGAAGRAAIYTNLGKLVYVISKVVVRIEKLLSYVLPSVQKR
jgi:hypothetical protein